MDENSYQFPDPRTSDKQGLVAIGGDLHPERILQAYRQGIFPWYEPGTPILWWSPNPRLILIPDRLKITRSLQKSIKKSYTFTMDKAFEQVINACATYTDRTDNTWITQEMIEAYTCLHHRGYAHSFEIWQGSTLVGGLYGISLGHAFFGESMFHTVRDASKIALYYLCQTIQKWNFDFIDCQMPTSHLLKLGAHIISRDEFLRLLETSLLYPSRIGNWGECLR